MDFETYINMGGYAFNVWGAYGLGILAYGTIMAHALWRYERLKKREKATTKK